jgi:tetratricopeptide (TPR) repeat protein
MKNKIYGPRQIFAGSLLGGPIAAVYFLWRNSRCFGNNTAVKSALGWGIVFLLIVFALYARLIPAGTPRFVFLLILVGTALAAYLIARKWQLTNEAIERSDRFSFQSNWRVLYLGVGFFILSSILGTAISVGPHPVRAYVTALTTEAKAEIRAGNFQSAIAHLDRAIWLDPDDGALYGVRALVEEKQHNQQAAIADLNHAIEIGPAPVPWEAYNELAWLLATADNAALRDGPRAVALALKASELSQWRVDLALRTLAASYARSGDYAKAIVWQQKAIEQSRYTDRSDEEKRLLAYRSGKAWPPE